MADMGDIRAQLDALRTSGAAERDPVRFAYLEALARRAATQPAAISQSLNAKISNAASELASRPAPTPVQIAPTRTASPLAELLTYIGQQAHSQPDAMQFASETSAAHQKIHQKSKTAQAGRTRQEPELKSVAYFRNEWSKLSTEQQLTQTLAQAPENAGPMNSQHLILRSLQVMRDISPDYLQGFMSYIDTLIWLEHADPTKPAAGRSSSGEGQNKTRTTRRSVTNR